MGNKRFECFVEHEVFDHFKARCEQDDVKMVQAVRAFMRTYGLGELMLEAGYVKSEAKEGRYGYVEPPVKEGRGPGRPPKEKVFEPPRVPENNFLVH